MRSHEQSGRAQYKRYRREHRPRDKRHAVLPTARIAAHLSGAITNLSDTTGIAMIRALRVPQIEDRRLDLSRGSASNSSSFQQIPHKENASVTAPRTGKNHKSVKIPILLVKPLAFASCLRLPLAKLVLTPSNNRRRARGQIMFERGL